MSRRLTAALAAFGVALAIAACGSSSSNSNSSSSTTSSATSASGTASASGSSSAAATPTGNATGSPVTLYGIYDTTGPSKVFGLGHLIAEQGAVAYMNAHGGIKGHKVVLKQVSDDGVATSAVSDLLQEASNKPLSCDCGMENDEPALSPPLAKTGLFSVTESDTGDICETAAETAKTCPNEWFVYPTGTQSQVTLVSWLRSRGIKKLGILQEETAFSAQEVKNFEKIDSGIQVTTVTFPSTAVDITAQMQQLKAAGVQAVYTLALGPPVGYALKARAALGWTVPIVIDVAGASIDITKLAPVADDKNAYEEVMWNEVPASLSSPGIQAVLKYSKPYGDVTQGNQAPLDDASTGWDSMIVTWEAANAAKSFTPAAMDAAMLTLPEKQPLLFVSRGVQHFIATNHTNQADAPNMFVVVPVGPIKGGQVQAP